MLGVVFDVGQTLSNTQRNRLRNTSRSSEFWSYVKPAALTPTWVHFDKRSFPSACSSGAYPLLRQGSRGLTADGIVGCNTWLSLQEDVAGGGKTSTTTD